MASLVIAFIVVRIFDHLFAGMVGAASGVIRAILFVASWTAVTTAAGMRGVSRLTERLKRAFGYNGAA